MAFNRNDLRPLPDGDVARLRDEIISDPLTLGYDVSFDDVGGILTLINAKNYTVTKDRISASAIRSACTYDAYDTLSIDEQEWIRWMTPGASLDEENVIVTQDLKNRLTDGANSIWAAAHRTEMNAAMLALIDVPGSRAEVLFGYGTALSTRDITAARDYV